MGWKGPLNVDASYDSESMSIGGGIDSRLKWITFTDYKTGKEIKIWSSEHKEYFVREQWAEKADMMVKEDINQLLKDLEAAGIVSPKRTTKHVIFRKKPKKYTYTYNDNSWRPYWSKPDWKPENLKKFELSWKQLKSAVEFYKRVWKNNTWKETLGISLTAKGFEINDYSIENLAKWFAEFQKLNRKKTDWKAWNDLKLLWLSKDIYTVKTKKDKVYKVYKVNKIKQSYIKNSKSIEPIDKKNLINKNKILQLVAERKKLDIQMQWIKRDMNSIKRKIYSQSYDWNTNGIVLWNQHYWNSYSWWPSLESKFNELHRQLNALIKKYNDKWSQINILKN